MKASSTSSIHLKSFVNFSNVNNIRYFYAELETYLLKPVIHHVRFWTALTVLGLFMSSIIFTFLGFAHVPLSLIMKPKPFLINTPTGHVLGFNLMSYLLKASISILRFKRC